MDHDGPLARAALAYATHLRAREHAERTIASRRDAVARYLGHLAREGGGDLGLDRLSRRSLEAWYAEMRLSGGDHRRLAQCTAAQRVRAVEAFWAWLRDEVEEGALDLGAVPAPRRARLPRPERRPPPHAPTWAQCDAAIGMLETSWWAAAVLCRHTGLRVGEVLQLVPADLDLADALLTVRAEISKTRRGRTIPVTEHLLAVARRWGPDGRPRLLPHAYAAPQAVQMRRAWEAAGVPARLWCGRPHHAFRKAFVSELLARGAPLHAIQGLVGHAQGVTVEVYTGTETLLAAMRVAVALIPPLGAAR